MNKLSLKWFRNLGIQGKLTLIFILLSSIPFILVSVYTVNQRVESAEQQNIREMNSDVKGLKDRTDLFLTEIKSEINLVMKSTELKKLSLRLEENQHINTNLSQDAANQFLNVLTGNNYYLKIDLLDKRGEEILSVINNGSQPSIVPNEDLSKLPKNYYAQIVKGLAEGEIDLSPSETRLPGSDKFIPVIDLVLPIWENNKVIAIATIDLKAEKFFQLLVPDYVSSKKRIILVNGEGYYIFHSSQKNNWSSLFANKYDENIFHDYPTYVTSKVLAGKEMSTIYYGNRIILFSPIFSTGDAPTNRYFIIEDVDAKTILASVDRLKYLLSILILFLGAVSVFLAYFMARRFLKPVKELIKGTQIIKQGELNYELKTNARNEIKDLVDNFNDLVKEWRMKQLLEKEVRRSERLFSSLTETATDAIIEIDSKGVTKVWNKSASRIFGFSKDETIGKNIIPLIVPEKYYEIVNEKLIDFANGNTQSLQSTSLEVQALKKDGTTFPAELSISSVSVDNVNYLTGIVRDITTRNKMMNDLVEAKNKAEIADRLKSEFLNQMSHEVRTPLNIILNYVDEIENDLSGIKMLPENTLQNLKEIHDSGLRIIRTIELILNMSMIQTGTYENNPKSTDLHADVLEKIYYSYKEMAKEKHIDYKMILKSDHPIAFVDPYSIEQIFKQIIENAFKFTEHGLIYIIIEEDLSGSAIVTISDTGVGISKDYMDNLFTPFSQEKSGLSRTYEGNGLGLALVKKLCDLNNISIEVNSAKGEGSSFKLVFLNKEVPVI